MMQSAVLSTRVQIKRNYDDLPFDLQTNYNVSGISVARTQHALQMAGLDQGMELHRLNTLSEERQHHLVQQQLITPDLLRFPQNSAVMLHEETGVSIMINEHDHLVIQVKSPTDDVQQVAARCMALEKAIAQHTIFAYHQEFGYLTSRVVESGIAMRGYMTLHLPLLTRSGKLAAIQEQVRAHFGMELLPLMVEDGRVQADLYQLETIVNAFSAPEDLYQGMYQGAAAVLEGERDSIPRTPEVLRKMEDGLRRSYGILKYASRMPLGEFLAHWSNLRTGAIHFHFRGWPELHQVDELLRRCMPARLSLMEMGSWLAEQGANILLPEEVAEDLDARRALVCRGALQALDEL